MIKADHDGALSGLDEPAAVEAFIAELKRWRDVRGVSQSQLASAVGYTPSYVSKVEGGTQRPSVTFSDNADRVLRAGGAIRRALAELNAAIRASGGRSLGADGARAESVAGNLVVKHDEAVLAYDGGRYNAHQRRLLYNASDEPVTRYLVRISVDRHPGDPERSNQLYRESPLRMDDVGFTALHEGRNPMRWTLRHDRDAFKELWLRFENEEGRFPLYPGEQAWIEYSYTVSHDLWGNWFQRAVRLPTERLVVRLEFPSQLEPMVWGMETTMAAEALTFRSPIEHEREGDTEVFTWSTERPPLHARYRLEWRFGQQPGRDDEALPSGTMASLGIVQRGHPILDQVARRFDLPAEAEDARRVVAELQATLGRVQSAHTFGKGVGIAAPQVGIGRSAALVRTPAGDVITLINPQVIDETPETDEQYEGCLSFFDVRGMVQRPLAIEVEHQDPTGERHITLFERGVARLVAHEVDHLNGVLYTERMRPDIMPIPVDEYRQGGQQWSYRD